MINDIQGYLLGDPIETEIGKCKFLTVENYFSYIQKAYNNKEISQEYNYDKKQVMKQCENITFIECLSYLKLSKRELLSNYLIQIPKPKQKQEDINFLKSQSLYNLVLATKLYKYYKLLLSYLFNDVDIMTKITNMNFREIRTLVMKMNCIKERRVSKNPELQKWHDKEEQFKRSKNKIEFDSILSSVAAYYKLSYQEIKKMTLYQLYMNFQRAGIAKNFDVSTLFSTVSTEKIKILPWYSKIDLFAEENMELTRRQFNKISGQTG